MPSISISVLSPYCRKAFHLLRNGDKKKDGNGEQSKSACCFVDEESRGSLFRLILQSQTAYALYVKLVALFAIAFVHAVYMIPFLDVFAVLASSAEMTGIAESYHLRHLVETLSDYKKNMWMIVGSMCVALSTSCFILLLNASSRNASYEVIVRIIDLLTFGTLPVFLFARFILLKSIHEQLPVVLHELQLVQHSKQLSSALHCSFVPVKEVPLCIQVIENALFPTYIIKFLIILAILTIAYILLAYLIEWCLRHWFPSRCVHQMRTSVYVPITITM